MKCESTELEIETIVNRIKNEDMDLQPDFQRGEIWTLQKKQKLIDSILRGWKNRQNYLSFKSAYGVNVCRTKECIYWCYQRSG